MEQFLYHIDAYVLSLSIVLTLVGTLRVAHDAALPVRQIPLFFLLLGISLIFSAMVGHLFENSVRAIMQAIEGSFVYDFRFYSLIFMGVVFIAISGYMFQQVKRWLSGDWQAKRNFIKAAFCLITLSVPSVGFTPIGILPTLACLTSFSAMPFTIRVRLRKPLRV